METDDEPINIKITPDRILQLSMNDAIVHNCIAAWRDGQLTWEQALIYAVLLLAEKARKQDTELLRLYQLSQQPIKLP